ncbi:hypothetical protein CHLNCDRAFT_141059 [Chlorella variabilis]|uniref:Reverse transcriptase domain-containing protein n=1 Tax=Chlorella variabilis TaxID=554065 RepID=E1ZS32_CHLVA|nr:hypothetical protein CHLNCDRAFT_141059 [Chlorella variabilis]EFN51317.1 hypothetical protein CHLNCDRAFT_141059 [Chlorella variabilis]|eukprot:XP_005843419.1 hypothetical protein CHLNCDRAFT_141059 [Chlorella variabilis]
MDKEQSGECVPPLFYADDQALLATTPAGLRFQLGYLESYCAAWGLTVNTKKTQVVVYTTGRAAATEERFRYGGNEVETVPTFRYLGVHLHCRQAFALAASYRAEAGRRAMHLLRRRLAENGLQAPLLSMRAFKSWLGKQWRTGSHWMAEETGRWQRLDRTQRPCPHCQAPLEDVRHAVYDCPLYAGLREEYAELFHSPGHALPSLAAFLGQARQGRLARFADRCHEEHAAALAQ